MCDPLQPIPFEMGGVTSSQPEASLSELTLFPTKTLPPALGQRPANPGCLVTARGLLTQQGGVCLTLREQLLD